MSVLELIQLEQQLTAAQAEIAKKDSRIKEVEKLHIDEFNLSCELKKALDVAVEGLESIKNRGTGNGGAVVTTTLTLKGIAKSALEKIKQIRESR